METKDVGPFSATGHYKFLEVLERAFRVLKRDNPDLHDRLGSAGCLCIRWVRGSKSVVSNHSFGLAIDLTIDGFLDTRGDNATQRGLFEVYKVFKDHGLFWGAEFKTEDSMHFGGERRACPILDQKRDVLEIADRLIMPRITSDNGLKLKKNSQSA